MERAGCQATPDRVGEVSVTPGKGDYPSKVFALTLASAATNLLKFVLKVSIVGCEQIRLLKQTKLAAEL